MNETFKGNCREIEVIVGRGYGTDEHRTAGQMRASSRYSGPQLSQDPC